MPYGNILRNILKKRARIRCDEMKIAFLGTGLLGYPMADKDYSAVFEVISNA